MSTLLKNVVLSLLVFAYFNTVANAQGGKRPDSPKPNHGAARTKIVKTAESKKPPQRRGEVASFTVSVVPGGSTLFLNDQQVDEPSLKGLKPGTYVLKVRLEGYQEDLRSITIVAGENAPVNVLLRPLEGTLNVLPNVARATIEVKKAGASDGERYVGNVVNLKLAPGEYEISINKDGYKPVTRKINLQASGNVYLEPLLEIVPASTPAAVTAAAPPQPVRATAADQYESAVAVKKVAPAYSSAARVANVTGTVTVSVQIDEQGRVVAARGVEGPSLLRQAAENAAKQWRFKPAKKNGQPVKEAQLIKFTFQH